MTERLAIGGDGSEYTGSAPHFGGSLGDFLTTLFWLVVVIAVAWILLTIAYKRRKK